MSLLSGPFHSIVPCQRLHSSVITHESPPGFSRLLSGWYKLSVLSLCVVHVRVCLHKARVLFLLFYPVCPPLTCHWGAFCLHAAAAVLGLGPAHCLQISLNLSKRRRIFQDEDNSGSLDLTSNYLLAISPTDVRQPECFSWKNLPPNISTT